MTQASICNRNVIIGEAMDLLRSHGEACGRVGVWGIRLLFDMAIFDQKVFRKLERQLLRCSLSLEMIVFSDGKAIARQVFDELGFDDVAAGSLDAH